MWPTRAMKPGPGHHGEVDTVEDGPAGLVFEGESFEDDAALDGRRMMASGESRKSGVRSRTWKTRSAPGHGVEGDCIDCLPERAREGPGLAR